MPGSSLRHSPKVSTGHTGAGRHSRGGDRRSHNHVGTQTAAARRSRAGIPADTDEPRSRSLAHRGLRRSCPEPWRALRHRARRRPSTVPRRAALRTRISSLVVPSLSELNERGMRGVPNGARRMDRRAQSRSGAPSGKRARYGRASSTARAKDGRASSRLR